MRACYVSGKVVDYFKTVQKQMVKMGENKVKSKSAPSLFSRGHNTNDSATVTNVKMFEKLAISKWPSRSFKVIGIGANWSDTCDFLLVLLCNYISIVYHFRDMASYLSKVADFAYPTLGVPRLNFRHSLAPEKGVHFTVQYRKENPLAVITDVINTLCIQSPTTA